MQTKHRSESLITGCKMEKLFTLERFPIYMMGERNDSEDVFSDMNFGIGIEDGFVQLADIIPPSSLYNDMHFSAIGKVWRGAHEAVAEKLLRITDDGTSILEIGGGAGKLNEIYNQRGGKNVQWDIVEPQPCPVDGCTARYIRGLFPDALENSAKYDIVLHTHSLEHMENMHDFFHNVLNVISDGGRMVFSVPDMQKMLEAEMTSIVNFEHTVLLTETYIDYLLGTYGFEIEEKQRYGNGHSLIYVTTYTGHKKGISLAGMYEKNKSLMMRFYEKHMKQISNWNKMLEKEKRPCYLFGAHISSQFFVKFGLDIDRITALLDNDPVKIGRHVCGIDKQILSPDILRHHDASIVILPKTPYTSEIMNGILDTIDSGVEFWLME